MFKSGSACVWYMQSPETPPRLTAQLGPGIFGLFYFRRRCDQIYGADSSYLTETM
jgi:hypothetical protein